MVICTGLSQLINIYLLPREIRIYIQRNNSLLRWLIGYNESNTIIGLPMSQQYISLSDELNHIFYGGRGGGSDPLQTSLINSKTPSTKPKSLLDLLPFWNIIPGKMLCSVYIQGSMVQASRQSKNQNLCFWNFQTFPLSELPYLNF